MDSCGVSDENAKTSGPVEWSVSRSNRSRPSTRKDRNLRISKQIFSSELTTCSTHSGLTSETSVEYEGVTAEDIAVPFPNLPFEGRVKIPRYLDHLDTIEYVIFPSIFFLFLVSVFSVLTDLGF